MLPINGIPLAVLAARRAANTGREVIVVTSRENTDDALAHLFAQYGISCFRGSLNNTLERIVDALSGYEDDALVFRLTADNVFPDGSLLDELERDFTQRGLHYLCCNGERSGLPYGMSAELTRARHLREAAVLTKNKYDQEHVTPFIRRTYGESYFEKYKGLRKGHFRCTIDCLDDYLAVQHVISGFEDATHVPAFDLIERLETAPFQPQQSMLASRLVLGTVQLGLSYGIANQSGKPDQATAEKLIKTAIANGAAYIDTARVYGNSEEIIGNVLKSGWEGRAQIVTKLSPLADCPPDATSKIVKAFVDADIYQSCSTLCMRHLDVLMLHRASHLTDWDGAVWARLLEHKAKGTVKALGLSVQNPAELKLALRSHDCSFIQLPFNVLDWRWDHLLPEIRAQRNQRALRIHVRSTLLQGLLLSSKKEHWHKANVPQPEPVIIWLAEQCQQTGRTTVADFCLSFVKSLDWVDGIVVGVESMDQLTENIKILCSTDLLPQDMSMIVANRPRLKEKSLNPACWSREK